MSPSLVLTNSAPTLQERLDSGELVHVTDVAQPAYDSLLPDIRGGQDRQRQLEGLRQLYGRDNVVTGASFDPETHALKPDPRWLGVYVTEKAFYSVHNDQ